VQTYDGPTDFRIYKWIINSVVKGVTLENC